MATHSNPARPGVFFGSRDSSPRVRHVSHPQNAKIDPVTPITKAPSASPWNGSNHAASNESPAGASPAPTCTSAATANASRSTIWKPTSAYWTRSLVVMPRLAIHVAIAMNTRVVPTLTSLFPGRSASAASPVIRARNR